MVQPWNADDWVGVLRGLVTYWRALHLIIGLCDSSYSREPAIVFSTNGKEWSAVVRGWVTNLSSNIRTPNEHTFDLVDVGMGPAADSGATKRMSTKEVFLWLQFVLSLKFTLHIVNIHAEADGDWQIVDNMWDTNPEWEWHLILNGFQVALVRSLFAVRTNDKDEDG